MMQVFFDGADLFFVQSPLGQFLLYFIKTNFVEFIDGDGDIDHFLRRRHKILPGAARILRLLIS